MADADHTDTDTVTVTDSTYIMDKTILDTDDFRVYDTSPDAIWETGDEYTFRGPVTGRLHFHRTDGDL